LSAASLLVLGAIGAAAYSIWPRPNPTLTVTAPTPRVSPTPSTLAVHLVGAVQRPGVYWVAAGARVEEVIALAGGLTDEADPASLNLAARVGDGQQILVRNRAEAPTTRQSPVRAEASLDGRVNINAASVAELDALPGLGPVLAQRIVERRQRLGPFSAIEQLRDEKLVPSATFEKLKDRLSTG
jgi:competence protein ComEA